MIHRPRHIALLLVLLAWAPLAWAQTDLAAAKAEGLIGERPDGLVALVEPDAPAAARDLIVRVNAQRLAEYRQIAQDTNAPLQAVQARAGRQIIERLPAGQYFMDAAGRWRRK